MNGTLEIDENMPFQRRRWIVERVGWGVFAAVCGAGVSGLLGPGALPRAMVGDGSGARIEFERFVRASQPTRLVVWAGADTARDDERLVAVALPQEVLGRVEVERITPAPERAARDADGAVWWFHEPPGSRGVVAEFSLRQRSAGWIKSEVRVADRVLGLSVFVYP